MKLPINVIYKGGPTVILEIDELRNVPRTFPIGHNAAIKKIIGPAVTKVDHIDLILPSDDQYDDNFDKKVWETIGRVAQLVSTKGATERLKGKAWGMSPWEKSVVPTPLWRTYDHRDIGGSRPGWCWRIYRKNYRLCPYPERTGTTTNLSNRKYGIQ